MRHLWSVAAAGLLAANGCSGVTEPESPGFEFASAPAFGVRRSPPVITPGDGSIEVSGLFEVPHSAFKVTGWLAVPGARSISLRVRGNPEVEGLQFPTLHLYRTRISRLPKGSYDLAISYVVFKGALRDSTVVWADKVVVR